MTISQHQLSPDLWLVAVRGRLDQALSPQLEQVLDQLLTDRHADIIVDLSLATYINSGGLRSLVTGSRRSQSQGGDLIICGLDTRLSEIFEMIGFDQIFTIYVACSEAREHF